MAPIIAKKWLMIYGIQRRFGHENCSILRTCIS
jgi:hypothetical protein